MTALMLACEKNHIQIVQLLLQHPDINLDLQERNGWTALAKAYCYGDWSSGHQIIVELLETKTPIINSKNIKEKLPNLLPSEELQGFDSNIQRLDLSKFDDYLPQSEQTLEHYKSFKIEDKPNQEVKKMI